ncbi:MAG: glycosyltransferase family 1 protein [Muribaculaceae bacterium]|nr:glycosyltransferase family 1 protein [Muribaculaceae bacterium]
MKILLLGDFSNYHQCLATALRELGHQVTVVSDGCEWMNTDRDIDVARRFKGKLGGLDLWIRLNTSLSRYLKGYDVVQINNPIFITLRPNRVRKIFDKLKRDNGAVFLTAMGNDKVFLDMCMDPNGPLKYNEWLVYGKPTKLLQEQPDIVNGWNNPILKEHCKYIYDNIDGATTVLYEYDLACRKVLPNDRVGYCGIPIDTKNIIPSEITETPQKVKFFLGIKSNHKILKGTDRFLDVTQKLVQAYPDKCELKTVQNLPYAVFIQELKNSHVLLDQLYSYTPATTALIGMAHGLTAVTGGEDEYYNFIGEKENRPIINAIPDDNELYSILENIVLNPDIIPTRAKANRDFVIKHNDSIVVAKKYLNFWEKQLNRK